LVISQPRLRNKEQELPELRERPELLERPERPELRELQEIRELQETQDHKQHSPRKSTSSCKTTSSFYCKLKTLYKHFLNRIIIFLQKQKTYFIGNNQSICFWKNS
jgi:collagenase-like PrtC family protease